MKNQLQYLVKAVLLLTVYCSLNTAFGQAPQKMSYQAVVRNAANTLIANTAVGVKISVLQTTASGTVVYSERHTPTTNANGLATFEIGGGTILSGTMVGINWANGPYFIKTETDPAGGTNYTIAGTSQLASVPYALFAANGGTPGPAGATGAQGIQGVAGAVGANGKNTLILTTTEPVGANCPTGGTRQQYGIDASGNGALEPTEINAALTKYVCNGLAGATGAQGPAGTASNAWGLNGTAGTTATSFIGTTDNKSLTIKTNNTQAMTIEPNGYTVLGSGVIGPIIDRFGIEGNALMIGAPVGNLDNGTLKIRNRGQALQQPEDQQMNLDGEIIQTTRIDEQGSYAADLKINPLGGNIGIGNTGTLQNKLQIGNPPGFSGNDIAIGNGVQAMSLAQSTTASTFFTNTNFAFMPASGPANVGIGTTAPQEKLEVVGNAKISGDNNVGGNSNVTGNINVTGGPDSGIYSTSTGTLNMVPIGIFRFDLSTNILNEIQGNVYNEVGAIIQNSTSTISPGLDDTVTFNFFLNPSLTAGYSKIIAIGNAGFDSPNYVRAARITNDNTFIQAKYIIDNLIGFRLYSYGYVMVYGIK